jgi:hypothetical protein
MKSGAPDHHKMRDLAEALGVPTAHAVGLMECFWRWVRTYAKPGDIGSVAPKRIAEGAKWDQDPEIFIAALVRARFLDKRRGKVQLVHDWWDHAEDSVHMALARERKLFACGRIPKLTRFSKTDREEILAEYESVHTKAHKSTRRVPPQGGECSLPSPPLPSLAKPSPSLPQAEPEPASPNPAERSVPDWLARHAITGPLADHVLSVDGVMASELDAARQAASAMKNPAAIACHRVCTSRGRPPPKRMDEFTGTLAAITARRRRA